MHRGLDAVNMPSNGTSRDESALPTLTIRAFALGAGEIVERDLRSVDDARSSRRTSGAPR